VAFVLYQVYVSAVKVGDVASERMNKKNVVFTKGGMKVGVKHVESEREVDKAQKYVVKAWNLSGKGEKK
jgi:hypothetical protein